MLASALLSWERTPPHPSKLAFLPTCLQGVSLVGPCPGAPTMPVQRRASSRAEHTAGSGCLAPVEPEPMGAAVGKDWELRGTESQELQVLARVCQ